MKETLSRVKETHTQASWEQLLCVKTVTATEGLKLVIRINLKAIDWFGG